MRLIPTSITQKMVDPNDPTNGMTLDALMQRQKQLQQQRPETPPQIASPWQGAALMANSFVNSMQQRVTQEQEAAGRQQLAQAMMQRDPVTGELTPEGQAIVAKLDPELNMKFIAESMAVRRAKAEREAGYAHEEAVNTRELGEQQAKLKEQRDWDLAHGWQPHPDGKPGHMVNKGTGEEKYVEPPTPEETWAPDPNDPTKLVSSRGNEKYVDKPTPPDAYRPMTDEDYVKYGITPDPNKPMTFNTAKNRPEPVGGGGVTIQNVPGELGAKLGMADVFNKNQQAILDAINSGSMSGPIDYTLMMTGRGPAGEALRQWRSGSEALIRLLTGAGMSEGEAKAKVSQYEPAAMDDQDTLRSKLTGLSDNLNAAAAAVQQGRTPVMKPYTQPDAAPPPSGQLGDQPPAAPAPAPAPAPAAPKPRVGMDDPNREAGLLAAAVAAIKSGKQRAVVEQILRDQGIDPAKLPQVP